MHRRRLAGRTVRDGSRVECPRTAELEVRLGQAGKDDSAPTVWLTSFAHLGLGLLWSWPLGKGTADERVHLRQMLALLPPQALIVADTAYMGNRHRMDYPEYLRRGWQIGAGMIESACKTVVGQRLKGRGRRWRERGSTAICQLRAVSRSKPTAWRHYWSSTAGP